MTAKKRYYIRIGGLLASVFIVIFAIVLAERHKGEREIERTRGEEVTIFNTEVGSIDKQLAGLPEGKAEEYQGVLELNDFIDMTIILYSAGGQEVWRKEVQGATIIRGLLRTYRLYEPDPVTIFKRTNIDVGDGQLVIIEK